MALARPAFALRRCFLAGTSSLNLGATRLQYRLRWALNTLHNAIRAQISTTAASELPVTVTIFIERREYEKYYAIRKLGSERASDTVPT
jgi:hypothetical protein